MADFRLKHDTHTNRWLILMPDENLEIVYDGFNDESKAREHLFMLNNCDHDGPDLYTDHKFVEGGQRVEFILECGFCLATASVVVDTASLKWERE